MRVPRISILMLAIAAFAIAPASVRAAESSPRVIVVSGSATVNAHPDVANLSFAVETHAPTAAESSTRNAILAEKVIAALKAQLGGKVSVFTGGYSLTPEYEQSEHRTRPKIIGYQTRNLITIHTGAIDLLGKLVDSALGAGANRVEYLNFSLRDDSPARSEAVATASRDAQAQARALAASLGVKLGPVIKATTVTEIGPRPVVQMRGLAMAARAATPIEPGEVKVPATVTLTYEIE